MATLEISPGQAIEWLQRDLGLSQSDQASALGASSRTLERWQANETYPQREARERLALFVEIHRHLHETFDTPQAIQVWFQTSKLYLGGFTPAEAARAGRLDRIEAALEALDSGIGV